jgi:hypothetical protein
LETVEETDLVKSLKKSRKEFLFLIKQIPRDKIDFAYAPGKWTLCQVVQHIIDSERVFAYRALSFARKDKTPLPSFDENLWAAESASDNRSWKDLKNEFKSLRKSNEFLFASFDEDQLRSEGIASNSPVNCLALGFICSGHLLHHVRIIKEKYLK